MFSFFSNRLLSLLPKGMTVVYSKQELPAKAWTSQRKSGWKILKQDDINELVKLISEEIKCELLLI